MQKPKECNGCPLQDRGVSFSRPDGLGVNGVLAIGESLGREEAIEGLPFRPRAQAGSALQKCMDLVGHERKDYRLWNLVACQPPDNRLEGTSYGYQAINHCKIHFERVLTNHVTYCNSNNYVPVILALGNLPLKHLAGVSGNAKEKQSITNLRGYPLPSPNYKGVWVIGGYHPSFIRRGHSNLFPSLMDDLQKSVDIANGTWDKYKGGKGYEKPNYLLRPSLQDAQSWVYKVKDNINLLLGIDIETSASELDEDERENESAVEITSVQFSLGDENVFFPFKGGYVECIKQILQQRNPKLGFNIWNFDGPILSKFNCPIEGLPYDLMWTFKHYQPGLPKNLQAVSSFARFPFPWKHMFGTNIEWYGCADVHSYQVIWKWLPTAMQELGVWKGYLEHLYGYYPILVRASERGIPVDGQSLANLKTEVTGERAKVFEKLEKLIPIDTRAVGPRRKDKETQVVEFGYKKIPKQLVQLKIKYNELKEKLEGRGQKVVEFKVFAQRNGFIVRDKKWCRLMPLKTSKEQILRYIRWKKQDLVKEQMYAKGVEIAKEIFDKEREKN